MVGKRGIQIWFFIGALLLIYGVSILGENIYELFNPSAGPDTVLKELHFGLWWGVLLTIIGLIYSIRFRPRRSNA